MSRRNRQGSSAKKRRAPRRASSAAWTILDMVKDANWVRTRYKSPAGARVASWHLNGTCIDVRLRASNPSESDMEYISAIAVCDALCGRSIYLGDL